MAKYRIEWAQIQEDNTVELPEGAIPLKVGLMLTGPLMAKDTELKNGLNYLIKEGE